MPFSVETGVGPLPEGVWAAVWGNASRRDLVLAQFNEHAHKLSDDVIAEYIPIKYEAFGYLGMSWTKGTVLKDSWAAIVWRPGPAFNELGEIAP